MNDRDYVIKNLNEFNTMVSQLLSIDVKRSNEDKCISLLFYLLYSWDSMILAIGSNATTLMSKDVVASFLSK